VAISRNLRGSCCRPSFIMIVVISSPSDHPYAVGASI
jgi:hypothetical protein